MKKTYIQPTAIVVTLNVSGNIMDEPTVTSTSTYDKDGKKNGVQINVVKPASEQGEGTGAPSAWGGSAKGYSAWDSWDD